MTVPLDRQPILVEELLDLRPLRANDFDVLFRVASDPLIWEQHPESDRYQSFAPSSTRSRQRGMPESTALAPPDPP